MLREFLADIPLVALPIVAMGIFLLLFAGVLLRVASRRRRAEYARMARLPLEDGDIAAERSQP